MTDKEESSSFQLFPESVTQSVAGREFTAHTFGKPRNVKELIDANGRLDPPFSEAFGPFSCEDEARSTLHKVVNFAFPIKFGNIYSGRIIKKPRGPERWFMCTHKKCPFKVCYELVEITSNSYGWYMKKCFNEHSDHSMVATLAEFPFDHFIPDEFKELR